MGAYGKVSMTENENVVKENLTQNFDSESHVEEQVNRFDNSYSVTKLQELYNEYDKITIDEDKIKSMTQVKANAVSTNVPFRVKLVLTTVVMVALLLAFLCFYNIAVINNMAVNINYLQEEVTSFEGDLLQAEGLYDRLTNQSNIQAELADMGFAEVDSSKIVAVDVSNKVPVNQLQGETNWFDAVCNFFSLIFG